MIVIIVSNSNTIAFISGGFNLFTGSFPDTFYDLSALEVFEMGSNIATGAWNDGLDAVMELRMV